jgi:hypothetical protein
MARTAAEVDQLVDDRLDAQVLGERGGQQQAGVGDCARMASRKCPPDRDG